MENNDEDRIKVRDELIHQKDRLTKQNEDLESENQKIKKQLENYKLQKDKSELSNKVYVDAQVAKAKKESKEVEIKLKETNK